MMWMFNDNVPDGVSEEQFRQSRNEAIEHIKLFISDFYYLVNQVRAYAGFLYSDEPAEFHEHIETLTNRVVDLVDSAHQYLETGMRLAANQRHGFPVTEGQIRDELKKCYYRFAEIEELLKSVPFDFRD